MRFLLDQDVYAATARFLSDLEHDVVPVARIGLSQADDEDLLRVAQEQNRIFVTRDRDFGGSTRICGVKSQTSEVSGLKSVGKALHGLFSR